MSPKKLCCTLHLSLSVRLQTQWMPLTMLNSSFWVIFCFHLPKRVPLFIRQAIVPTSSILKEWSYGQRITWLPAISQRKGCHSLRLISRAPSARMQTFFRPTLNCWSYMGSTGGSQNRTRFYRSLEARKDCLTRWKD